MPILKVVAGTPEPAHGETQTGPEGQQHQRKRTGGHGTGYNERQETPAIEDPPDLAAGATTTVSIMKWSPQKWHNEIAQRAAR